MPGQSARYGKQADVQPQIRGKKKQKVKDLKLPQPLPEKGPAGEKRLRDQGQEQDDSGHKRLRLTAQPKSRPASRPSQAQPNKKTPNTPAVNVLARPTAQLPNTTRAPEAQVGGGDVDNLPQGYVGQSAIAGPSGTSQPLAGISKVAAVPSSFPNEIDFGGLHSVDDPEVKFPLRMVYNGSTLKILRVGRAEECEIWIPGLGIGGRHCALVLQLEERDGLPIRRRLWLKRLDPQTRILQTSVVVNGKCHELEDQILVPNRSLIRFGSGGWFAYQAAKFSDLYEVQDLVYGGHEVNLNSSVLRVKRRGDNLPFVVKVIPPNNTKMATTELSAFKILGYHPRIVRLVEAFYDVQTRIHRLVLEPASMDLNAYATQLRGHSQALLSSQARRMTAQLSSAVAHIHRHNMAHRDLKPQNVLVRLKGLGNVDILLCDLGIVRLNTRPINAQLDCPPMARRESKTLAYEVLVNAGTGKKCIDFLKKLLVGFPEECMEMYEVLQHPYIARALSKLSAS
ncbi:hypothetical protein FRC01_002085 [Tulasnella sp. 417]|nr:hypothetical protein FRC01_002085 [Tulasnella sp. 417]